MTRGMPSSAPVHLPLTLRVRAHEITSIKLRALKFELLTKYATQLHAALRQHAARASSAMLCASASSAVEDTLLVPYARCAHTLLSRVTMDVISPIEICDDPLALDGASGVGSPPSAVRRLHQKRQQAEAAAQVAAGAGGFGAVIASLAPSWEAGQVARASTPELNATNLGKPPAGSPTNLGKPPAGTPTKPSGDPRRGRGGQEARESAAGAVAVSSAMISARGEMQSVWSIPHPKHALRLLRDEAKERANSKDPNAITPQIAAAALEAQADAAAALVQILPLLRWAL